MLSQNDTAVYLIDELFQFADLGIRSRLYTISVDVCRTRLWAEPSVIELSRLPLLVSGTLCRAMSCPRHLCQFSVTAWRPTSIRVLISLMSMKWLSLLYTDFQTWPKFTNFFAQRRRGYSYVDHLLFRFSTCWSVPETFAIKFETCQKWRRILDVFALPQFVGGGPSESCKITTPASRRVAWSFVRLLPLAAKM